MSREETYCVIIPTYNNSGSIIQVIEYHIVFADRFQILFLPGGTGQYLPFARSNGNSGFPE